jgi:hypothetical protein
MTLCNIEIPQPALKRRRPTPGVQQVPTTTGVHAARAVSAAWLSSHDVAERPSDRVPHLCLATSAGTAERDKDSPRPAPRSSSPPRNLGQLYSLRRANRRQAEAATDYAGGRVRRVSTAVRRKNSIRGASLESDGMARVFSYHQQCRKRLSRPERPVRRTCRGPYPTQRGRANMNNRRRCHRTARP